MTILKIFFFAISVFEIEEIKPLILENVINSVNRRTLYCRDEGGGHITQGFLDNPHD